MNREIEFRGKRLDNSEWLYGNLMHDNQGGYYIYPLDAENLYVENKVDPDTVGQFTGLVDKNGVKIFEGDIVKRSSVGSDSIMYYYCGVVLFDNNDASFKLRMFEQVFDGRDIGLCEDVDDIECDFVVKTIYDGQTPQEDEYLYEVIGNIHDNPELLASK